MVNKKLLRWNLVFQYGYVLTNILNSLILLPLYVSFIDDQLLGLWLATGNVLAWLTMADPGIGDVLQQKIAELKGAGKQHLIGNLIGSGFLSAFIIFLLAIITGVIFYLVIDKIIAQDLQPYPDLLSAFLISILSTAVTLVSFALAGINQGLHNASQVAISYISSNFLFLIVNIVLLWAGYGVMSIAGANLARAAYLVIFNLIVIRSSAIVQNLNITFDRKHFRSFIRIFSFTSVARVISSFASNIDLVILARFVPAGIITLFEINRRPVKMLQSLTGRYSVALMPAISHAKGSGEVESIRGEVSRRFVLYAHITLIFSFLIVLMFSDLLQLWVGPGYYAGDVVVLLLAAIFFFSTIGYFFSNMCYAVGDIRMNSLFKSLGGLAIIAGAFFGARFGGMEGMLMAILLATIVFDFFLFLNRLRVLAFIDAAIFWSIAKSWLLVVPVLAAFIVAWKIYLPAFADWSNILRLILSGVCFMLLSVSLLYMTDPGVRKIIAGFRKGSTDEKI
jgi:O-antigen/teichoic acid export membrane protein